MRLDARKKRDVLRGSTHCWIQNELVLIGTSR